MPSPGEYSPREQRFINGLAIFTAILLLVMGAKLLWACAHADFTAAVEHSTEAEK